MNALAPKVIFFIALQIKMQPINNYLYMAILENKIHKKEEKLLTHMNILEYQLALEHP